MLISSSQIVKPYVPRSFGKEYVEVAGSLQYPMFVAASLGIKPLFDDFIDTSLYERFLDICKEHDLFVKPDVVFESPPEDKGDVIGAKNITTTFQSGRVFTGKENGKVHVFVGSSKKVLLEAKKFGWYSVVINNRSTNKPFVDHLRYGELLGFPSCCVDFFRRYNNWHLYSHPYEIYKHTLGSGKSFSYHCNNFLMDNTYSYIHHLPCSYNCEKTRMLAKKIESGIGSVEPKFVENANTILKKPLLVFAERDFVIFDGDLDKKGGLTLKYENCEYLRNPARSENTISFFNDIQEGNSIEILDDRLVIRDGTDKLSEVKKKPEWFAINFQ
ncbi:hypothetical protein ISS07_04225 [Candidatus Woesearchaeota archaeon]|nr:hypothetical protein [Candidatus Woesearchaeota archaeon]